jgi:GNAT superfamily N-acetyltransferase
MPDGDLEQQPLIRQVLYHDERRDKILPGDAEGLADDAPLSQKPGRLEPRGNDRIHPARLLRNVEHDGGDRLGRRFKDRLHIDVETAVLGGEPPDRPEDREDRKDRSQQRSPDDELDDDEDERRGRELLGPDGSLLKNEVIAAAHSRAVDEERREQEPTGHEEDRGLDEKQDHRRASLDSPQVGQYVVSSDTRHVDRDLVWRFLHDDSYWATGVPRDVMERAINGSICFSAFSGDPDRGAPQVAFARVVTDRATFAWLCDVFVIEEHRGKGVSRQLLDAIMSHPDLQGLRNVMLATRDAQGLYARYGFTPLAEPARWMAIRRPYRA